VKIDDLLDLLTDKASAEVAARNAEFTPEECRRVGAQIAVGAIRYFMLKFSRGKLIVFDIEEALAFQGESGPYLQYTAARADRILRNLAAREGPGADNRDRVDGLDGLDEAELQDQPGETHDHNLWAVVLEASRLDEMVDAVVRSLEFSTLAKYAFGLAQRFNAIYHDYPVIQEEQPDRRRWRAAGVAYVRDQLTKALDLMGIAVPERM
jgi:arginyl-tRNA synthetase